MDNKFQTRKQLLADTFTKVSDIYESDGPMYFTYYGERLIELADITDCSRTLDLLESRGELESCKSQLFEALKEFKQEDGIHSHMKAILSYCSK